MVFSPLSVRDAEQLLPNTLGQSLRRTACTRSRDCPAVGSESRSSSCSARCSASYEAVSAWKAWLDRVTPRSRVQKNTAGGLCSLSCPGMATPPSKEVHSGKVQSHSESKLRGGQEVGSWELQKEMRKHNVRVSTIEKTPQVLGSDFPDECKQSFILNQGSV